MTDETKNPLSMPDEDMSEVNWDDFMEEKDNEEISPDEDTNTSEDTSPDNAEVEDKQESEEEVKEVAQEETETEEEADEDTALDPDFVEEDVFAGADEEVDEEKDEEEDSESEETEPVTEEVESINYKAEYERLTSPFKASNKEMKVDNVDEAISLMQMGVDYAKKMTALKPSLRIVKTLEKNELLSEEKINYLIDLSKHEPNAVKKLIQESSINLNDFDPEVEVDYKSNTYTASDQEVELDGILASIRDTESYGTTLQVLSNKWDEKSRSYLLNEEPKAIALLNQHIANGIYDKVMDVVEKKRLLGDPEFRGLSDLEAYDKAGRMLFSSQNGTSNTVPVQAQPVAPKAKTPDPKLIKKKKAAAPTKGSAPTKTEINYNPLSMSDEDFAKLTLPR